MVASSLEDAGNRPQIIEHRFATGKDDVLAFVWEDLSEDVNHRHGLKNIKIGVAPFAAQIAGSKTNENMGNPASETFTLNGMKYFDDVVNRGKVLWTVNRLQTCSLARFTIQDVTSELGLLNELHQFCSRFWAVKEHTSHR